MSGKLKYEIRNGRRVYLSEWEQAAKDYINSHYGNLVGYDEPELSPKSKFWRVPLHVIWVIPKTKNAIVFYGVGELEVRITKDCKFEVTKATSRMEVDRTMGYLIERVAKARERR